MLPQRGSSLKGYFENCEDFLSELGKSRVSIARVKTENVSRNVIGFVENDGNILLLFHPLLSALYLGKNYFRLKSLLARHSKNVIGLLHAADNGDIAHYGASYSADRSFFESFDRNDLFTVSSAVDLIVHKLSQTVMKKKLTVLVDKKCKTSTSCVGFTQIEYVLGELLAMCEYYGKSEKPTLQIGCANNCFMIVLVDKVDSETGRSDEYYLKIFGEFMRLIDVGTSAHVTADGELIIKAFLPFSKTNKLMASAFMSLWDYFDYMRAYFVK